MIICPKCKKEMQRIGNVWGYAKVGSQNEISQDIWYVCDECKMKTINTEETRDGNFAKACEYREIINSYQNTKEIEYKAALYRKKPVVISAFHYLRELNITEFINWIEDVTKKHNCESILYLPEENEWYCKTLEGNMKISDGDYVICGVNKEVYPCKPDIFEKTYEKVE